MKINWEEKQGELFEIVKSSIEKIGDINAGQFYDLCDRWKIKSWSRAGDFNVSDCWYMYKGMVCINAPYMDFEDAPDCLFIPRKLAEKILILGCLPESEDVSFSKKPVP